MRPAPGTALRAFEARLPGRLVSLVANASLDPVAVTAQVRDAAARKKLPPHGFNYFIFARGPGGRRQLLDIGMAKSLTTLRGRLREKLGKWGTAANPSGKRWSNLRVNVSILTGVPSPTRPDPPTKNRPSSQPPDVDMKLLHCHELIRQYKARRRLQQVANYRAGSWTFDDFEELLRESLD
jgi:hypothetical protein